MKYKIINTGSNGNATIVENIILIDCGISFKKLKPYINNLKLVLLTHIHTDHFNKSTIKRLAYERPTLRFGCCSWLVQELIRCGVNKRNIDVYEFNTKYTYNSNLVIETIELYHDVPNCGYRVFINDNKVIYMTDTRTLDGISATDYDLYLVEANYENEEELHNRAQNEYYESRVKCTHLSKEYTINWLLENMSDNSKYVFMHGHKERKK